MVGADGSGHSAVRIEAGGTRRPTTEETLRAGLHTLAMEDGPSVMFAAVDGFVEIARVFLRNLGMTLADVDLVVPHQANVRILERVGRLLGLPAERMFVCAHHTGNVGGASVGIACDLALRAGRLRPGTRVLLLTAGAGYTMGAALLEVPA
jgi:3-oxoacyl-[acyl-carrier-protein] synthase-3